MVRTLALVAFVLLAAVTWQARPASADGIGFFPAEIAVSDALRGQRYVSGTVLINQTEQDRTFRLTGGGDIGPWLSFAAEDTPDTVATEFVAPAGSRLRLIVYVGIPETAANGDYSGEITMENHAADGRPLEILQAFQQSVSVTVSGTQVLQLRVGEAVSNDVEAGKVLRIVTNVGNESNIDVVPSATVVIHRFGDDGTLEETEIGRARSDGEKIPAGGNGVVTTPWDTLDQPIGHYRAAVTVSAQGVEFGTRNLDFEIVPAGSLVRGGSIRALTLVGDPPPGTIARVDVTFANDGKADVVASFVGEVYKDDQVVTEADSKVDASASAGAEATISTFFPVDEPGRYVLRGRVKYEGAQTEEATLEFMVGSPDENNAFLVRVALMTLGIVVVGGGAGFWLRRRSPKSR